MTTSYLPPQHNEFVNEILLEEGAIPPSTICNVLSLAKLKGMNHYKIGNEERLPNGYLFVFESSISITQTDNDAPEEGGSFTWTDVWVPKIEDLMSSKWCIIEE